MKTSIVLLLGLLLMNFGIKGSPAGDAGTESDADNTINVFCSPDLYNLATIWADEFCNLNLDVRIKIVNTGEAAGGETFDVSGNLGLISSDYSGVSGKSTWNMVVGRDVIVPIFNANNPFADEIYQKGISPEELAQIAENKQMRFWGSFLDNQADVPVNIYLIEDESINSSMASLSRSDQTSVDGIMVSDANELITAVQNDPYSLGLCQLNSIPELADQGLAGNVKLMPIDRNGNGRIDYMEQIYYDPDVLSRGVWIGKYPKALINNIYFISAVKPENEIEKAFIQWTLTDGQQFLGRYGYSELALSERQSKAGLFNDSPVQMITAVENYAITKWLPFIMGSFALLVIMLVTVNLSRVQNAMNEKPAATVNAFSFTKVFDEELIDIQGGFYYDKTHTWTFMEKDGMVRVGIDDFLQHITGPLTRVKMKKSGERVRKGKPVLSIIQNGKQLNIHAPVSGTIKEYNKNLVKGSSLINTSPHSDGWVYRIEPSNWIKEIQYMLMGKKYREWLKGEFSRLKDFLSACIKPDVKYAQILQDGGELRDGILEDLGPEVWEDFQMNFIDQST